MTWIRVASSGGGKTGIEEAAVMPNEEWALDFISDKLASGRSVRVLNVVDAFTRECVALQVDTSFASRRVTRVLEEAMSQRGWPRRIRCDNGLKASAFVSFFAE